MTKLKSLTIEEILNKFPEVIWDRWIGNFNDLSIFGWIKRRDGKSDFLILDIFDKKVVIFRTSSAKLSKSISKKLGFRHEDCKRVENYFSKVKCIKLK